jgi:hypothetical protein
MKRVHPAGFEPATLGSEDRCAIQLCHGCVWQCSTAARSLSTFRRYSNGLLQSVFLESRARTPRQAILHRRSGRLWSVLAGNSKLARLETASPSRSIKGVLIRPPSGNPGNKVAPLKAASLRSSGLLEHERLVELRGHQALRLAAWPLHVHRAFCNLRRYPKYKCLFRCGKIATATDQLLHFTA